MSAHLSWLEASVIGLVQGVSELFPISSLGHSVLIPAVVGGSWASDLDVSRSESPYLAFIVGLHVATALALIIYFWRDWVAIIRGLVSSIRHRRIDTAYERLAWLLVAATIPVGLVGLVFEHQIRTLLAKPTPTALFLILNGLLLFASEQWRRRTSIESGGDVDEQIGRMPRATAMISGTAQIAALAPGISRSGIAMAAGRARGLTHDQAARFSFLLATPVILAAGVLKLPDLAGPLGDGIRPQVLVGSLLSGVGAYVSVRFLDRYFQNNSLRPFGVYCVVAGVIALVLVNR